MILDKFRGGCIMECKIILWILFFLSIDDIDDWNVVIVKLVFNGNFLLSNDWNLFVNFNLKLSLVSMSFVV